MLKKDLYLWQEGESVRYKTALGSSAVCKILSSIYSLIWNTEPGELISDKKPIINSQLCTV